MISLISDTLFSHLLKKKDEFDIQSNQVNSKSAGQSLQLVKVFKLELLVIIYSEKYSMDQQITLYIAGYSS